MIRLLVATLLLAAIAVTVRLKARGTGATRSIKISARAAVNRGSVVAIVEAEGRRLLIGAAANQVTVLADLGSGDLGSGDLGSIAPVDTPVDAPSVAARLSAAAASSGPRTGATATRSASTKTQGRHESSNQPGDTLVQRVRQLTTRTADPTRRPKFADALREGTRRAQ